MGEKCGSGVFRVGDLGIAFSGIMNSSAMVTGRKLSKHLDTDAGGWVEAR